VFADATFGDPQDITVSITSGTITCAPPCGPRQHRNPLGKCVGPA
jgi:hypothetical protein